MPHIILNIKQNKRRIWKSNKDIFGIQQFDSTLEKQSDAKYIEKMTKLSPTLSQREREVLKLFLTEGDLGVTQIKNLLNIPPSSTHKILTNLEQSGLVQRVGNKRRILSDQGFAVANIL